MHKFAVQKAMRVLDTNIPISKELKQEADFWLHRVNVNKPQYTRSQQTAFSKYFEQDAKTALERSPKTDSLHITKK